TESLDRGVDHPRIDFLNALPGKTHAVYRAGREILDHHVAFLDEFGEYPGAGIRLGIERDAAFAAVQHGEIQAVDAGNVTQLTARGVAFAGLFHLDHVSAEICQNLRGSRAGLDVRHVQDPYAVQSLTHDVPFARM